MWLSHRATPTRAAPPPLEPFSLSSVTLDGTWAEAQRRNQEVLMSLNFSRWACHFTTTANLTSCASQDSTWFSYQRKGAAFTKYNGFLGAGNDVQPPKMLPFSSCEKACAGAASCVGFTFEDPSPVPKHDVKCYIKSAWHFTGQTSQGNCVSPGGVGKPLCSPLPGEMGLGGYYGHYQGHWLSATAFLYNNTGNETVRAAAASNIATLSSVMSAWKSKYGYDGYLFPYDPLVFDKLLSARGAGPYYSVPFYTLHKLMAGLLDQASGCNRDMGQ